MQASYGRDVLTRLPAAACDQGHAEQHLFVDVGVRPALDDDGRERLEETAAAPREAKPIESAPQQDQQQQQQQQQQ